jgi:hypothetical protein
MDYWFFTFVGALLAVFLISRLFLWLLRKWTTGGAAKYLVVAALTFAFSVIVGGFGYADGGPWAGVEIIPVYGPAVLVVLLFDLIRTGTKPRPLEENDGPDSMDPN